MFTHSSLASIAAGERHLGLAIGVQPPQQSAHACIRQFLLGASQLHVSEKHAILGLTAGIAKIDALIASIHIQIITSVPRMRPISAFNAPDSPA